MIFLNIRGFMKNYILCAGEVLWDEFPHGSFPGGAPLNVAFHLQQLGQPAMLVSRVGRDEGGERLYGFIRDAGIEARFVETDEKYPTRKVIVSFDDKNQPVYEIVRPSAWDFLELSEELTVAASTARALVFGSLAQRNEASRSTIATLRACNCCTVFDVNLRPPFDDRNIVYESLSNSRLVKMNDTELRKLSKWFGLPTDERSAAMQICDRFGCETICITLGSGGAALWHQHSWTEHAGYPVWVSDTVGAGDAFLAALLIKYLDGCSGIEMLRYANAAGAHVASQSGATPIMDDSHLERIIKTKG